MKLHLEPELAKLIGALKTHIPEWKARRKDIQDRTRIDMQCTGQKKNGEPCKAWAVWGNPDKRCFRHGGAVTAKIPRSERVPACRCAAYAFPHRLRGGLCNFPNEPTAEHSAKQGQRKYYKRIRRTKFRKWLKESGV